MAPGVLKTFKKEFKQELFELIDIEGFMGFINFDKVVEKIDKLRHLGNKFFPTPEETEKEIKRLLDRTEVFELTIEHMSGKITVEK